MVDPRIDIKERGNEEECTNLGKEHSGAPKPLPHY